VKGFIRHKGDGNESMDIGKANILLNCKQRPTDAMKTVL